MYRNVLFVFLFVTAATLVSAEGEHRILALHSYHIDYLWTARLIEGLDEALQQGPPGEDHSYQVFHEFMDTKRFLPSEVTPYFLDYITQKYGNQSFDAVFISDEAAYAFFYAYGEQLFAGVPMVFTAVDTLIPDFDQHTRPHTGVMEIPRLKQNIELIQSLHPNSDSILILSDERPGLNDFLHQIQTSLSRLERDIQPLLLIAPEIDEIEDALQQYPDAPMLYLGYFRGPAGNMYTLKESVDLLRSTGRNPIYTAWDDALYTGVVGGYMTSGYNQGYQAGSMLYSIIHHGTNPADIAILDQNINQYFADYSVMQEFGLKERDFPAATVFVNRPTSVLELYRNYFYTSISVIAILTLLATVLIINIRRRRSAEKRGRALQKAVESTAHAVYLTDSEGIIQYANPAFAKLTGYSENEIIGRNPRFLQSGEMSKEYYIDLWITIKSGQVWSEEIINQKKDGSQYYADQTISPLTTPKGAIEGFVAVQRDTSASKRIEQELLDAKHQAELADSAKSSFLASMSHEIRTPLNGIIGFSKLIQEANPDSHILRYANLIDKAGEHLAELINDILDLSRIEAGMMELKPETVNLQDMLNEILQLFSWNIDSEKVSLILDTPDNGLPLMELDPLRTRQVVMNLIANAVKFTHEGTIRISTRFTPAASQTHGTFRLSVSDTGIGISNEDIAEIFKAFRQADSSDRRKYQGTGLGLAITRRLVEQMGGEVSLNSTVGQGSVFSIEIPDVAVRYAAVSSNDRPDSKAIAADTVPPAETLLHAFISHKDAVKWLNTYQSCAVRLQERSVPDEIRAWAQEQLNDEAVLGGSPVSQALNELQTGADNWDIVRMNQAWNRLDSLADKLQKDCSNGE